MTIRKDGQRKSFVAADAVRGESADAPRLNARLHRRQGRRRYSASSLSYADVRSDGSQLIEVDGLSEMGIETGVLGTSTI